MSDRNISGILCIDKPEGYTSHDAVNKIRRLYGTRKVGHTGTLDPMATGVLVVLIGKATKLSEILASDRKRYIAEITLGITTDTQDITGNVIDQNGSEISKDVFMRIAELFKGKTTQIPPMVSAKKVNGKKLYDLARNGITVERKAEEIEIFSLNVIDFDEKKRKATLDVECSKGTYIRTLCHDIGIKAGTGACMSSLRRISTGAYSINNCSRIEDLEQMTQEERDSLLIPVEESLSAFASVVLPDFYARLCSNGCEIYQKKINDSHNLGDLLRMYDSKGTLLALGRVREFENGTAIKPVIKLDNQ
ncbi:MAG: tRNA pseudouridine(55) synthase TruB [Clostridia bacterium]|nr:tRNA pseudouridine(55) synthase TruB [Clostridia bacterium]